MAFDLELYFHGNHDDVIKWKHFPRNWPFVRGIHRSPVNSPHKGQWRGALMFTLICARINVWVNTREAGDLRRYCPHYDVIVMLAIIKLLKYGTSCRVRSTVCTVLDSHFGTNDHAWNDLLPWPITSRSFNRGLAIKLLNYCRSPHLQFWMNSCHMWHKWSLA